MTVATRQNLAISGGTPVRTTSLPYGRHWVDEQDIEAVAQVMRSDFLTTGPKAKEFENAFAEYCGAKHTVAVCNGTAALHAAMYAIGIGPGDEVIVPSMTFAASANCVVYQGGTPVFADVEPDTLLIDPAGIEALIGPRTKAIIAVDYAGQACDYDALRAICDRHGLRLVADGCHAAGGAYRGRKVGSIAELTAFSLHPVKNITTGEGGLITTDDADLEHRMRVFRTHGITTDALQRGQAGSGFYEMVDLGYNYRITDIQCALGLSQLARLPAWSARRREIAGRYDRAFAEMPWLDPLATRSGVLHAYHLYVVRFNLARLSATRAEIFAALRAEGFGVVVHYIPVHLHPFYRERYGTRREMCPVAELAYEEILSLPMFPHMSDTNVEEVLEGVRKVTEAYAA